MNINQLEYFVETVRCQSINKAAQNLYINQSTLTTALKSLESEIGCDLLIRSRSGVKTTPEGDKIYFDAIKMLNTYKEWLQLAKKTNKQTITISCLESLYNTLFCSLSMEVALEHPNINLVVQVQTPNEMLASNTDTIFMSSIYEGGKELNLKTTKKHNWIIDVLLHDQVYVYVNAQHPLANHSTVTLEELSSHKIVISSHPDTNMLPLANMLKSLQIYYLNTPKSMLQIAKDKDVCAILPGILHTCSDYSKGLHRIPISDFDTRIYYYLCYPPEPQLTTAQKIIIELIKEHCEEISIKTSKNL